MRSVGTGLIVGAGPTLRADRGWSILRKYDCGG